MIRLETTAVALLLALFLSGCGQSGPLYLPGNPSQVQVPPAETGNDAEAQDEDDDEDDEAEQR